MADQVVLRAPAFEKSLVLHPTLIFTVMLGCVSLRKSNIEFLTWLETVSSTFQDVNYDGSALVPFFII